MSQRPKCFAIVKLRSAFTAGLLIAVGLREARPIDFARDIQPIFEQNCYKCHGPDKQKGGLRLDTKEGAFKTSDSGEKPIIPGAAAKSKMIQLLLSDDRTERMPLKADPLPPDKIALLKAWIDAGAAWPEISEGTNTVSKKEYWAFRPVARPQLPPVKNLSWPGNPIDRFILAKLEKEGLSPATEADRISLIRRLSFDVRGLPPTESELKEFIGDDDPLAYERLVDRYLGSPQFGERWGQHWLDLVRYAETEGFEYDNNIPDMWRYRDYVIQSVNNDKPFHQFVTEQIAGDEIAPDNREALTAVAFHRLGAVRRNAGNPELVLSRNEVLTERTDVIGAAFLGLTVGCARCHNHKFDPITQQDYYRLEAFMASTQERNLVIASTEEKEKWHNESREMRIKLTALKESQKKAEGADRVKIESEIEELEAGLPEHLPTIPSIQDGERTPIHVLKRGDWEKKGDPVNPRPLSVLVAENEPELSAEAATPRVQLARWLTNPAHPLTARVIVNRLWEHHFGQGIVKTPNDFGVNGARPSHPELLDWLASELVERGWHLKAIHRLILLSNTYRQSSSSPETAMFAAKDPENRLLWHFNRRRLSAEEIRDGMLSISGLLNPKAGGPSVLVPVDKELVNLLYKPSQWKVTPNVNEHNRRSVYLLAKRNLRLPFMEVFDQPAMLTSCARRESSTHAPQALELLNGKLANGFAGAFAQRLENETHGDNLMEVRLAYQLAAGRLPTEGETRLAMAFLRKQPLKELALAIFNLNDFLYVR